jgi:hypothetical protein
MEEVMDKRMYENAKQKQVLGEKVGGGVSLEQLLQGIGSLMRMGDKGKQQKPYKKPYNSNYQNKENYGRYSNMMIPQQIPQMMPLIQNPAMMNAIPYPYQMQQFQPMMSQDLKEMP